MFGQFFNILYSIVDRIYVGQIPQAGETALASIGICARRLTACLCLCLYGRYRWCIQHEHFPGAKDEKQAKATLGNAVFLLFVISIAVTGLLLLTKKPFTSLLVGMQRSFIVYPMRKPTLPCIF